MTYPAPAHTQYAWSNAPSTSTPLDKAHLEAAELDLIAYVQQTAGLLGVAATAIKTGNYTAAAGEFVPVDATSGTITVTLPSAPADATRVGVVFTAGFANACSVACAGTDVLRKAAGSTSVSLVPNQAVLLQYQASTGVWHLQAGDQPLQVQTATVALSYSASITPNALAGEWQTITVTNNSALTINAPTNPPASTATAELTVEVLNSSGGAMGVITWNAAFVFATGAWTNPASTKRRFARFEWNGTTWVSTSVATADY